MSCITSLLFTSESVLRNVSPGLGLDGDGGPWVDPSNGIDRAGEFDVRTGVAEDWIELYDSLLLKSESVLVWDSDRTGLAEPRNLLFKSESVLRNVSPELGLDQAGGPKEWY